MVERVASTAMTLTQCVAALSAQLQGDDVAFDSVSTDTRKLTAGALFVALQGPNYDGHDFIGQAKKMGAVAALVSEVVECDLPMLRVADTRLALGQLASLWRQRYPVPLVAVTGSNGKTTVKEMLASILSCKHQVLVTQGNLNNEIGVPLTLLNLGPQHQYGVIEMGASKAGDINYLTRLVQPEVAIITNAAPAHLEGFGDIAGVARAKGEIFNGLVPAGTAIINADDARADVWRILAAEYRILSFGLRHAAEITAVDLCSEGQDQCQFTLCTPVGQIAIMLDLVGRHNVMNALAATAAALALAIPLEEIKQGLESMVPVRGRLTLLTACNNARLIDDTYNANPGSIRAALDVLKASGGKTILVLGDMGELGNASRALHEEVGRQAQASGVTKLYSVGDYASLAAGTFGASGQHFDSKQDLINALRDELTQAQGNCTVLVKGSRSMHMEQVVEALKVHQDGSVGESSDRPARVMED